MGVQDDQYVRERVHRGPGDVPAAGHEGPARPVRAAARISASVGGGGGATGEEAVRG
jgi:hypothetical protein